MKKTIAKVGVVMAGALFAILPACASEATPDGDDQSVQDDGIGTTNAPKQEERANTVSARCNAAFASAAAKGDMEDSVTDLYPAAEACLSIQEWTQANEANPGAIDKGVNSATFARNMCLSQEVADAPLCRTLR